MASQVTFQQDQNPYANYKTLESALDPEPTSVAATAESEVKHTTEVDQNIKDVEKSALKVKNLLNYELILCQSPKEIMDKIEVDGTMIEYPTNEYRGYLKRSNQDKDWSQCTAVYKRCVPVTPNTRQKAFDANEWIPTFMYKAKIIRGTKDVMTQNTIKLSAESFSKLESELAFTQEVTYTQAEMEAALKKIEAEMQEN